MAIKNVAVIGASGNVGVPIVKALLAASFHVTAVARESSTSTFPADVDVRRVDFSSVESLTKAFAGQDAVVSTIATGAIGEQDKIVSAVLAAGVGRFVPSEFGVNTVTIDGSSTLGTFLAGKTALMAKLKETAKENPTFTYTGIATGLFFDWGLDAGTFGISLKDKSINVFDSGNEPMSASSLEFVGASVAAALKNENETTNQYLEVVEFTTTQNELLKIFEEETGAKFAVTKVPTDYLEKTGGEKLAKGDYSSFVEFLLVFSYRDGKGHAIPEANLANSSLGLPKSDLRTVIKEYIKSRSA